MNVTTNPDYGTSKVYGYGTLAVLVVSACAPLGLVLVRAKNTRIYLCVMTLMMGLAIGTLTGDAFLHLIPQGLGLHDQSVHDHNGGWGIQVEDYTWKMTCGCASIWAFFLLQMTIQYFELRQRPSSGLALSGYNSMDEVSKSHSARVPSEGEDGMEGSVPTPEPVAVPAAWMIAIGDAVHNFADGLAVGAAFTVDWKSGVSTTIAILCHELPHEFGGTAIMLGAGWSIKKILLFRLQSAIMALVGMYTGIAVSETQGSRQWIFLITAGMFLYIALSDVVPEVFERFKQYSPASVCLAANCGILLGFAIMLLIAVFEEYIQI